MRTLKYFLLIFSLVLFVSINGYTQDTTTNESSTVGATAEPAADDTATTNKEAATETPATETSDAAAPVDTAVKADCTQIEGSIDTKVQTAKTTLKQAEDNYNAGDYDKGAELADKAKGEASEIETLKTQLGQCNDANSKIDEAKSLINQAENQEADKYAADDLASAKTSLLSAQNSLGQNDYDNAVKYADESINSAKACLTTIDEKKKALEQEKLEKGDKEIASSNSENSSDTPEPDKLYGTGEFKIKTTYKVRLIPKRRDCLWRIAEYKYVYNNPWKWPAIYKANKNQIKNPDLIYPGQNFDIPELDENGNPILKSASSEGSDTESNPEKEVPVGE